MTTFPVRFVEVSQQTIDRYGGLETPFNFEFEDADLQNGINYGHYDAQVFEMQKWCAKHIGQKNGPWRVKGWMFSFWQSSHAIAFKLRWG